MLGKEHVLSTIAISFSLIIIIIFQHFLKITDVITTQQIFEYLSNLPKIDYIYLILFFLAMVLASTAPDIDVEQPQSIVKRRNFISSFWFTTVKYIAYLPMASLFEFSKNKDKTVGHRKIFHSLYGAVAYTISIVIIFIIFSTLFLFLKNALSQPSMNHTIVNGTVINKYVNTSLSFIKQYWNFVLAFLIGSFIGFIAHLFEDSLTVSGVVYLPFITDIGLKGRLRTGSKEFYESHHVRFFEKSEFGMIVIWIFNLLFIWFYFVHGLYLLSLIETIFLYTIFLVVFMFIFTGLRISRFYRF
jgi:hypothetical protein